MLKKLRFTLLLVAGAVPAMQAQKQPTATRTFDIQAGGEFTYARPDYTGTFPVFIDNEMKGYGFYGNIDFLPHVGLQLDYHKVSGQLNTYERTYEVGGRYVIRKNRWTPYVKVEYGRGVINGVPYIVGGPAAFNLASNMIVLGGGADYKLKPYLNLRGDFEYQDWFSNLGLPNGITPYLGSIGVAYHFR